MTPNITRWLMCIGAKSTYQFSTKESCFFLKKAGFGRLVYKAGKWLVTYVTVKILLSLIIFTFPDGIQSLVRLALSLLVLRQARWVFFWAQQFVFHKVSIFSNYLIAAKKTWCDCWMYLIQRLGMLRSTSIVLGFYLYIVVYQYNVPDQAETFW